MKNKVVAPPMEGGPTTEEYRALYPPELAIPQEVFSLAMSIDAKALDFYRRAADWAQTPAAGEIRTKIARQAQVHLAQPCELMDAL